MDQSRQCLLSYNGDFAPNNQCIFIDLLVNGRVIRTVEIFIISFIIFSWILFTKLYFKLYRRIWILENSIIKIS